MIEFLKENWMLIAANMCINVATIILVLVLILMLSGCTTPENTPDRLGFGYAFTDGSGTVRSGSQFRHTDTHSSTDTESHTIFVYLEFDLEQPKPETGIIHDETTGHHSHEK